MAAETLAGTVMDVPLTALDRAAPGPRQPGMMRRWLGATLALLLAGCAGLPPSVDLPAAAPQARQCLDWLDRLDAAVDAAGVADAQASRVPGFPFLRVNRFLAGFRAAELGGEGFAAWLDRLIALDRDARRVEIANLPPAALAELAAGGSRALLQQEVTRCGVLLRDAVLASEPGRTALIGRVRVPDDYLTWQRVLGLYPLTVLPFAAGIANWHRQTGAVFAMPPERLAAEGDLVTYFPSAGKALSQEQVAQLLRRARGNPLGIPEPWSRDERALLDAFAPVLVVDTTSPDDRIGALVLDAEGVPRVDGAAPTAYTYLSHARFEGRILLQLNYVFWFPSRPATGPLDILAGKLDGIVWRVTLEQDGSVLAADSMHNCGCYHLFFPSARLRPREREPNLDESAFAPQALPPLKAGERFALRIAHRTHYLQRIFTWSEGGASGVNYRFEEYDGLRTLPLPGGGTRSAFGPDGIVPGTQRGERFLFWPMGVPDPGAMRQRGHHATAFVGRRHFDDPQLLERAFERK